MVAEVTSIGIVMETSAVERGVKVLRTLAEQGPKVEKAMGGISNAASRANANMGRLGGDTSGLNAVGKAAEDAAKKLGWYRDAQGRLRDESGRFVSAARQMEAGLTNVARQSAQATAGISNAFSGVTQGATTATQAVGRLNAVMALAGAGVSVKSLIDWVDGYTKFTAQLRNATDSTQAYATAMEDVKRISTTAQAGMGELGVLYARIASSTKELGISQEQVARITETVALSLKANGAGANEAASAMLQLSQAFGSGVLRGEEFNAVYEAAPNLLRNLADAMGVPQGKLREMAADGKLTADVLAKYLPQSLDKVAKEAERMATVSGSFTVLNNKIMEFVGGASNASGAARAISSGVLGLANNLDTVATAAGALALVMGARYVGSLRIVQAETIRATAATVAHQVALARTATVGTTAAVAMRGLSAAIGLLGGPVGAVIAGVGLATAAIYSMGDSAKEAAAQIGGLDQPLEDVKRKLAELPPEKRVSVMIDLEQSQKDSIKEAQELVEDLIQSVAGASSIKLPLDEFEALTNEIESTAKAGGDLAPVLQRAAEAGNVSQALLQRWLDLASNIRAARNEANAAAAALASAAGRDPREAFPTPAQSEKKYYEDLYASQQFLAQRNDGITKTFISDMEGLAKAYESGALSATEYARAVTELNKKRYESTEAGKAEAKSIAEAAKANKTGESAYKSLAKSIADLLAQQNLEISTGEKLTNAQKLRMKVEQEVAKSKQAGLLAQIDEIEAGEAWLKNQTDVNKALADMQRVREQSLKSVQDSVRQLLDEAEAAAYAETHNVSLAEAVERLALARAENAYQQAIERQEAPATLDYLRQEIEARKELVAATAQKGVKEANKKAAEQAAKDWERVSQTIGDTLADYIMSGGKDAATYLKRLFSTLVLQPVVQTMVSGVLGTGAAAASGVSSGGVGGIANLAQQAYSAFTSPMFSNFGMGLASNIQQFGGTLFTKGFETLGTSVVDFGNTVAQFSDAINVAGDIFGYGTAIYNLSQGKYGSAIGTAVGTYFGGPIGAMIGSTLGGLVDGAFGGGTPHGGAAAGYSGGQITDFGKGFTRKQINSDYTSGMQAGVSAVAATVGQSFDALAAVLGKQGGYRVTTGFSADSDDPAWGRLQIYDAVGSALVDWNAGRYGPKDTRLKSQFSSDPEKAFDQYLQSVAASSLPALKDIAPAWADAMIDGVTQAIGFDGNSWKSITVSGQEAVSAMQSVVQQIALTEAGFASLGNVMSMFSGISDDMKTSLLGGLGGIEGVTQAAGIYYNAFYSEEERLRAAAQQVNQVLTDLQVFSERGGLDVLGEDAKAKFRQAVEEVAAAGNGEMLTQLLGLAGAFDQVASNAHRLGAAVDSVGEALSEVMLDLLDERKSLEAELLRAQGDQTGYLAAVRAIATKGYTDAERAAWDYNTALQSQVEALDAAAARTAEVAQERAGLEQQLLQLQGDTAAIRARERAALDESNRALYDRIAALQDEQAAQQAAAQMRAQIDQQAYGLTTQLLQLQGDTSALRARERAALDESNRALYDRITALQDEQAAARAAALAVGSAWGNLGTMSGLAAQYTGNTSGLTAQLGTAKASFAGATDTNARVAALQQIISLEQGLFEAQTRARQAEVAAAQRRADAAREQLQSVNQLLSAAKGLGDYASKLFMSEQSGLSDAERLAALGSEYSSLMARAKTGDADALQDLQGVSSDYLRLAEQMSASQADYSVLSGTIAAELASAAAIQEAAATSQAARLERQIEAAERAAEFASAQFQVSMDTQKLIDSLLAESMLGFATEAEQMAQLIATGQTTAEGIDSLPAELAGLLNATLVPAISGIADAARAAAAAAQSSASMASAAIAQAMAPSVVQVPGFASGGFHSGGLRLVGERGPELEVTGPARYFDSNTTARMLGGGMQQSSNAELIAEIKALRTEVAALRSPMERTAAATTHHAELFDNVSAGGDKLLVETRGAV